MENKSIGTEIKNIDNMIIRKIMAISKHHMDKCLSPIQIGMMKYLIKHKGEKVYQKDIEKKLCFRKSTISGVLQTMEKNGLIKRIDSEEDARSKEIVLTKDALEISKIMQKNEDEFNAMLEKNISSSDLEIFFKVTNQIQENLKEERNKIC